MVESDSAFTGSIPEFYDTYLVPLIFEQYAEDLAARVVELPSASVLEIAAGSGVVTRAVAPRLATDAQYVVTDLNLPMLDHAASRQGDDARISWQQADALNLPFDDEMFDVVLCQFSVMFFPDRVAGYTEARRVLKDGGSFLFNVWDDIEFNAFADVITQAVAGVFPDDPPQFLTRTPYGYHDEALIRGDLMEAGFVEVDFSTVESISSAAAARDPAVAFCQGTPLRNEIEARDASLLEHSTKCAADAIAARFGSTNISAKIRGLVIKATR